MRVTALVWGALLLSLLAGPARAETTLYTYDDAGRLSVEIHEDFLLVYSYDAAGNVETKDVCEAGCFVDGVCHPTAEPQAAGSCLVCDSSANPLAWSFRATGTECDDGDDATTGDVCDAEGQCTGDGDAPVDGETDEGCACSAGGTDPGLPLVAFLLFGSVAVVRRRRSGALGLVVATALLAGLAPATAEAHFCTGAEVTVVENMTQPGVVVVQADLTETDTEYTLSGGDMSATVTPGGTTTSHDYVVAVTGLVETIGPITWNVAWHYIENGVTGTCTFTVTVIPDPLDDATLTAGSVIYSGYEGDPVNTFTGELVQTFSPDLRLQGPMPLGFARYYASGLAADGFVTARLGTNWSHNFQYRAIIQEQRVGVVMPTGRVLLFARSGDGWVAEEEYGTRFQLVDSGDDLLLGDPDRGRIYTFDSEGVLILIEDGRGNAHTLTYDAGRLDEVTDGLGRTLAFEYAGELLVSVTDGMRSVSFTQVDDDLVAVTDVLGRTTGYVYASPGLHSETVRPEGNVPLTSTYDATGRVVSQTDAEGNTLTFAYNQAFGATTMTYPGGEIVAHVHDEFGQLVTVRNEDDIPMEMIYAAGARIGLNDRLGDSTFWTTDPVLERVISAQYPNGVEVTNGYAVRTVSGIEFADMVLITRADGSVVSQTFDAAGNLTSLVDPMGNTWESTYNDRGQLLTATRPDGGVTTYAYGPTGDLVSVTDATGAVTTTSHDALSRPISVEYDDGTSIQLTWNDADQLVEIVDEVGGITRLDYDLNGLLVGRTLPGGSVVTFEYDDLDRVVAAVDGEGNRTERTFDDRGRLASVTDAAGDTTTLSYSVVGKLSGITEPGGATWSLTHDAEGVPTSITDPLGNTTEYTSDSMGLITGVTTALGTTYAIERDAQGRVVSTLDPLDRATELGYDARGLLTEHSVASGALAAQFERDALGLVEAVVDAAGQRWELEYDLMGRPSTVTDPLGRARALQYDDRGRLEHVDLPAGTGSIDVSYDDRGVPTTIDFGDGEQLSFVHDADGRLLQGDGLSFAYDDAGRVVSSNGLAMTRTPEGGLASVTLADGRTVTYTYDVDGHLVSVTDWVGGTTTFAYDDAGRLSRITRPDGTETSWTYDDNGKVLSIDEGEHGAIALSRDDLGRIVRADRTVPTPELTPPERREGGAVDEAAQVAAHEYDGLGRLIADDDASYTWSQSGRLLRIGPTDGEAVDFGYDAAGQRTSRTAGGETLEYVWNDALGRATVQVLRQGGEDVRYYVTTPGGQLLHSIDAGSEERHFFHFDELGNTTFLTDDSGTVAASYAFTAYGESLGETGEVDNPFTWQGRHGVLREGSDGLYSMRARLYAADEGRFLSRDPVRKLEVHSTNPYQYARGNPMSFIDPDGRYPFQAEIEDIAKWLTGGFDADLAEARLALAEARLALALSRLAESRAGLAESRLPLNHPSPDGPDGAPQDTFMPGHGPHGHRLPGRGVESFAACWCWRGTSWEAGIERYNEDKKPQVHEKVEPHPRQVGVPEGRWIPTSGSDWTPWDSLKEDVDAASDVSGHPTATCGAAPVSLEGLLDAPPPGALGSCGGGSPDSICGEPPVARESPKKPKLLDAQSPGCSCRSGSRRRSGNCPDD